MKVSELEGSLLDYWVGKGMGMPVRVVGGMCMALERMRPFQPSTVWQFGGPIIERERIDINTTVEGWEAYCDSNTKMPGSTALEAAMRAYVAWKFGGEVEDAQPESAG